jgi:hypothetical protein
MLATETDELLVDKGACVIELFPEFSGETAPARLASGEEAATCWVVSEAHASTVITTLAPPLCGRVVAGRCRVIDQDPTVVRELSRRLCRVRRNPIREP